ncbi:MAG: hypothetical protein H6667_08080 [Ardenticatenaceae bacterium]|nr:hypothetical protein [Ardenticatenaceae bacterium]MCB9444678.1 hypothetical protein [Ardenticatenaceae bacterium]
MSLREAETSIFKLAQFRDGWWDILLGGEFTYLSFYALLRLRLGPLSNFLLFIGVLAVLITVYLVVRKIFVAPRLGRVKFGMRQNRQMRKILAATSFLVLLSTAVGISLTTGIITEPVWPNAPSWVSNYDVDMFFTVLIIGFFSVLAYVLDIARLHLYGWLLGLGNLASTILEHETGAVFHWPMFVAGMTMIVIGAVLFASFLRDYPEPVLEA